MDKLVVTLAHNAGLEPLVCQQALQETQEDYSKALYMFALTADHQDSVEARQLMNNYMDMWDELCGKS